MLILIKASRPLRCQRDKSRRCRQPGVGSAARAGMPGLGTGLQEGCGCPGLYTHPAAVRPAQLAPGAGTWHGAALPAKTAAGGWEEAEAEIRAPLGSESRGGTKSAQPHPRSITSSAGSVSLSTSFCLRHLPALFGCFILMRLPVSTLATTPKDTWF